VGDKEKKIIIDEVDDLPPLCVLVSSSNDVLTLDEMTVNEFLDFSGFMWVQGDCPTSLVCLEKSFPNKFVDGSPHLHSIVFDLFPQPVNQRING